MAGHLIEIAVNPVTGSITIPSEHHVSVDDTVTWQVATALDAPWLVSFLDGRAFRVEPISPEMAAPPNSLEVRNGQQARALSQRGRFLYRLAVVVEGRIYGIFDCPTIIIK